MPKDEAKGSERERALAEAYEQRSEQLTDTRGALAEAVAALTVELGERRSEAAALRAERDQARSDSDVLRADNQALRTKVDAQTEQLVALDQMVAAFQKMKVVRWSAPVRGFVYRLRARRR